MPTTTEIITETAEVLYDATEVTDQVHRLAEEIRARHLLSPLFICILKGGALFTSMLNEAMTEQDPDYHPEVDYARVSTYLKDKKAGTAKLIWDGPELEEKEIDGETVLDDPVEGRNVILLDDTYDTGKTTTMLREHYLRRGAKAVELAVLVEKNAPRDAGAPDHADFAAFRDAPNVWLQGMGLDNADVAPEAFRWLNRVEIDLSTD